jgi:uncharacterized membrane protein YkgB
MAVRSVMGSFSNSSKISLIFCARGKSTDGMTSRTASLYTVWFVMTTSCAEDSQTFHFCQYKGLVFVFCYHPFMNRDLVRFDLRVIRFVRKISPTLSRIALFVVFFWFGALKVFSLSPASPLASALLAKTMPFMGFDIFMVLFGLFEMLIGILFLIPRAERLVFPLLGVHMITTVLPLVMLPSSVWSGFLVPTLEGQYIIKNIVIIALAMAMAADMHAWKEEKRKR